MFGDLERTLDVFQVEALSADYLFRATLQPLGALPVYLNDRNRQTMRLNQVALQALSAARKMGTLKRDAMSINKQRLLLISLTVPQEAEKIQVIEAKRPVVFYLRTFIVRGNLHVYPDASDHDLLDEARDYFPVTDATLLPLEPVAALPERQVALLFLNRHHVAAYHVHRE